MVYSLVGVVVVFPSAAVRVVRPGFGDDRDSRSPSAAEFGVEGGRPFLA